MTIIGTYFSGDLDGHDLAQTRVVQPVETRDLARAHIKTPLRHHPDT